MTAPNEYEPSAEAVEALAKEIWGARCRRIEVTIEWEEVSPDCRASELNVARFILHRQHARELALTSAMGRAIKSLEANFDHPSWAVAYLTEAIAAHAKLDAPKVPTVRAAVLEAQRSIDEGVEGGTFVAVPMDDWLAIKAAVEREDRGK